MLSVHFLHRNGLTLLFAGAALALATITPLVNVGPVVVTAVARDIVVTLGIIRRTIRFTENRLINIALY